MPVRFSKVSDNLYRGGAPEIWEIAQLKNEFGINKIISLDKQSANNIKQACKANNIEHLIIPIHSTNNLFKELQILYAGVNNIVGDDICYVHCYHGKDRTGTFVAKYRVENGWDCYEAIKEALKFGFGTGVDKDVIDEYLDCIIHSCKQNHSHVSIYKLMDIIEKLALCNKCGYVKTSCCTNCIITNALIKNANVLNIEIDNTSKEDVMKNNIMPVLNKINYKQQIKLLKATMLTNNVKYANEQKISFEIPANELKIASECLEFIKDFCENTILKVSTKDKTKDILDIIEDPFNEASGLSSEQLKKAEKFINLFCELFRNNMIKIKQGSLHILEMMEIFNSGEKVENILSSLFDIVDNLDKESSSLINILGNIDDNKFQENLINAIKIVKKRSAQLKQLLNERLVEYLRKDILGEDWSTEIKKDLIGDKQEQQENMKELNLKKIK